MSKVNIAIAQKMIANWRDMLTKGFYSEEKRDEISLRLSQAMMYLSGDFRYLEAC